MATTSLPGLEAFMADLGLGPVPYFATADVLNDPLAIYHSFLAEDFGRLVESDPDLVYKAIQPPNTIQDGDLDIVLPRLKLSGGSPKELGAELLKQVCQSFQFFGTNEGKRLKCLSYSDSTPSPLWVSLPGWHPPSILFLSQNHSATPTSLHQRPKPYIRHCQVPCFTRGT